MKFYLSKQGQQLGPWPMSEILSQLDSRGLAWTDYLFDETQKEWVLLMDHPLLTETFRSWVQPGVVGSCEPLANLQIPIKTEKEWFILKEENKYGPFNFLELIRMLQEKTLYEFDFIWNAGFSQWKRVAEVEDFQPNRIKSLQNSSRKEIQEVFFRRRYARAAYGTSLLVHNSKAVWKAKSLEISPGGAAIIVENADFSPGQTLFLHFKAGDEVPPFNAICSVVSRQLATLEGPISLQKYGVKFTNISQSVQKAIRSYTEKIAA